MVMTTNPDFLGFYGTLLKCTLYEIGLLLENPGHKTPDLKPYIERFPQAYREEARMHMTDFIETSKVYIPLSDKELDKIQRRAEKRTRYRTRV